MTRADFTFFWGGPFSQWAKASFTIDGKEFNCCEQYMMFKKAEHFGDTETAEKIMNTSNPKTQKMLGRQVKGFNKESWDKVCRQIVYDGNYAKFTQNDLMLKAMKATRDTEIVEASPFDRIWGIGLAEDHPDVTDKSKWLGTNWLGEAIMQVRVKLREEGLI